MRAYCTGAGPASWEMNVGYGTLGICDSRHLLATVGEEGWTWPNLGAQWRREECCLGLSLSLPPATSVPLAQSLIFWVPSFLTCNMEMALTIAAATPCGGFPTQASHVASVPAAPLLKSPNTPIWVSGWRNLSPTTQCSRRVGPYDKPRTSEKMWGLWVWTSA